MTAPARAPLLGFWMCVALVVGNSIGSGVFLLPASLAPYGLNSVVAWGFTSAGALLLAVVFASLSRSFPHAGGPYGYVKNAFGPLTAFLMVVGLLDIHLGRQRRHCNRRRQLPHAADAVDRERAGRVGRGYARVPCGF